MDLETLSYSIGTLCLGLAAWNGWRALRSPPPQKTGVEGFSVGQRASLACVDHFQKKVRSLEERISLLEEHAGEYLYVLQENGLPEMIAILDQLDKVSIALDVLVKNRKIAEAEQIVCFLEGGVDCVKARQLHQAFSDLEFLTDWEARVNTVMKHVAGKLSEAAERTRELGIDRSRKRKATLVAVNEILQMLEQRHSKKAGTEEW